MCFAKKRGLLLLGIRPKSRSIAGGLTARTANSQQRFLAWLGGLVRDLPRSPDRGLGDGKIWAFDGKMNHCLLIIFHCIFVRHEFNDQHDEPLFLFPEISGFIPFKRVPSAICQTEDRCPVHVAVRCSCCFPTWRLRHLACQRALHCQNAKRTEKIDPGNGGFPI